MQSDNFDAIIVGAGQAGPPLAERCSQHGWRTAIIERAHFGGTCVNTGCIPTKALVASARAIWQARRGDEMGFEIDGLRVQMKRLIERKQGIVEHSRHGVEKWMRGLDHTEVIEGEARFVAPHALQIGQRRLNAPRIFLNVGARPSQPDIEGVATVDTLDNASIMELREVPQHLVIVGASYIGLEFAQMMRRFGAAVTVVEQGERPIAREDEDVSVGIRSILEAEGIAFEFGARCISLQQGDKTIAVGTECKRDAPKLDASHVLLATGRRPNTDSLGLESAGVDIDEHGYIVVDNQCRSTSAEGVWAMGDCNGRGAFTHTAYNDFQIVAANLFDDDPRRISDRIPCYALYIDPALGRIGVTERQARDSGVKLLGAKMPMARVGRAREAGETQGFMKVLVNADSRKILGAAILGRNGDEVVHSLLDMMSANQPYTLVERTMHIHPTVSELLPTLFEQLKPLDRECA